MGEVNCFLFALRSCRLVPLTLPVTVYTVVAVVAGGKTKPNKTNPLKVVVDDQLIPQGQFGHALHQAMDFIKFSELVSKSVV